MLSLCVWHTRCVAKCGNLTMWHCTIKGLKIVNLLWLAKRNFHRAFQSHTHTNTKLYIIDMWNDLLPRQFWNLEVFFFVAMLIFSFFLFIQRFLLPNTVSGVRFSLIWNAHRFWILMDLPAWFSICRVQEPNLIFKLRQY